MVAKDIENCELLPCPCGSDPAASEKNRGWILKAGYTSDLHPMAVRLSLGAVLAVAALVTLLVLPLSIGDARHEHEEIRAGLLELVRERQPEIGRFAGSAAPGSPASSHELGLTQLVSKMRMDRSKRSSPEALGELSLLSLAEGKSDRAVSLMERAAGGTTSGAILNDLAAVYLSRAAKSKSSYDLVLALESASRALQQAPSLAEAKFNRAIALEKLFLDSSAYTAWQGLLKTEVDPSWAKEERRHLEALAARDLWTRERALLEDAIRRSDAIDIAKITGLFPQQVRLYAQETLLPLWAREHLARKTAPASRRLQGARWIGDALGATNGDRSVIDSVEAIRRAEGERSHLDRLAAAHLAYAEGVSLYDRDQAQEARKCLEEAADLFRAARAPAGWAEYWRAVTEYYTSNRKQALRRIGELLRSENLDRAPSLRGRLLWTEGLASLVEARFEEALSRQRLAMEEFDRLGEKENSGALRWLRSETLSLLGDRDAAWRLRGEALRDLRTSPSSVWLHNLLLTSGQTLLEDGRPLAARNFADEILLLSVESKVTHLSRIQARILRARIAGRLGDGRGALAELREALTEASLVPDSTFRDRVLADAQVVEGEIRQLADPAAARDLAGKAIGYYLSQQLLNRAAYARLLRAEANLTLGDSASAADDFELAIEERERAGRAIRKDETRIAFLERWQNLFDNMVELDALERGDPSRAFDFIERAKATGQRTVPLSLRQIQDSLSPDVAIVEYASLRDRLLIWVVRNRTWDFVKVTVDAHELERLTNGLLDALEHCQGGHCLGEAERLYEYLVQPIERSIDGASIVLVPDKGLSRIPYAVLRDPVSSRYLVERTALVLEPSASHFIEGLSRAVDLPTRSLRILAVGDPAFNRQTYSEFTRLPGAAGEATQIAALYPTRTLLMGEAATSADFLAALPFHDIVHFAGHSISNPKEPALSKLLFAQSGAESPESVLFVRDLQGLRLDHLRLVVLSACSTSPGSQLRGEGFSGFARPLLAAGVQSVLTSLWRVNDDMARRLLISFHHRLLGGQDGAGALRGAQLEFLRATDPRFQRPRAWAGFQLSGNLPESTDRRNE